VPEVAVIGGGPAGLIAAEELAKAGASVTVYEHKRSVGRKFLLAGRGGLNITHAEPLEQFLARYGPRSAELLSALEAFTPDDLREWCAGHDEPTFVGTSQRVFPESFRATPLLRSWIARLGDLGVSIVTGCAWKGWTDDGALRLAQRNAGELVIRPDATLFALGGASWPRVGSDGSWVDAFEQAGIAVARLQPANCGVNVSWSEVMRDRWSGHPIKNAVFTVGDISIRGDAVVTDSGLEGGPIYALGPAIRSSLELGETTLHIGSQPDLDHARIVERLSKRRPKASIASWLDAAGISKLTVTLAREATNNSLPQDPSELASLLQAIPLHIEGTSSLDRAISTAGGVAFEELTTDWMVRRRPGTFVAGEMVDWEAPTGGYLLQACFSTGVAAARGLLAWCGAMATN